MAGAGGGFALVLAPGDGLCVSSAWWRPKYLKAARRGVGITMGGLRAL
ncbi:hypothetical protein ABT294_44780 [Nonomuraea sp. NPDC000554]